MTKCQIQICYPVHEQAMRADALADKLLCNNVVGFWKEVRALNRTNTSLLGVLEGVSGSVKIAELWRQHYSALFNCIKSSPYEKRNISNRDTLITCNEVYYAVKQLADKKASGSDHITAEHLSLQPLRRQHSLPLSPSINF